MAQISNVLCKMGLVKIYLATYKGLTELIGQTFYFEFSNFKCTKFNCTSKPL